MNIYNKLRKSKILFVGSDEWIRDSMIMFFEDEGCSLLAVETAEEAMTEVQAHHFDLIISDNRLPGIDGIEFFIRIRHFSKKTIKILIISHKTKFLIEASRNIGIHDLIEKPFKPEAIEVSLAKLLN